MTEADVSFEQSFSSSVGSADPSYKTPPWIIRKERTF